jgi:hypothetical protein
MKISISGYRIMHRALLLSLCAVLAACLASCVHEFPEEEGKYSPDGKRLVAINIHLSFPEEMPLYTEAKFSHLRGNSAADSHDLRYIIRGYRSQDGTNFSRTPDTTFFLTTPIPDGTYDLDLSYKLSEGYWRFHVWTDYVESGSIADKYYNSSDFANIILLNKNDYEGNNDYRDAFKGEEYLNLDADLASSYDLEIPMKRPVAKVQFISTDYSDFVANVTKTAVKFDINDYNILISYPGFMPTSFNMFTDRPTDVWTGVRYYGNMIKLNDNEAQVGFDYIFVNDEETKVSMAISVYDQDGIALTGTKTMDVPLLRGHLTIVRGSFLTSEGNGGVGIDPGFTDEFNIEIK